MSTVESWDQVAAKVERMAERLDLGHALKAGGFVIEGLAKIRCPVDTDNLRSSIQTREVPTVPGTALVHVGTHVEYAAVVEFGFSGLQKVRSHERRISQAWGRAIEPRTVTVSAHTRNVNRAAKPYLRPAFDEGKTTAVAAIRADLVQQLRTLASGS